MKRKMTITPSLHDIVLALAADQALFLGAFMLPLATSRRRRPLVPNDPRSNRVGSLPAAWGALVPFGWVQGPALVLTGGEEGERPTGHSWP